MILTLKVANQALCMTLRLIIMHQSTKFGNKLFDGLEDIFWTNTDNLNLRCDLDLECSDPFLYKTLWLIMVYHQTKFGSLTFFSPLRDTLAYDAAPRYQVW